MPAPRVRKVSARPRWKATECHMNTRPKTWKQWALIKVRNSVRARARAKASVRASFMSACFAPALLLVVRLTEVFAQPHLGTALALAGLLKQAAEVRVHVPGGAYMC